MQEQKRLNPMLFEMLKYFFNGFTFYISFEGGLFTYLIRKYVAIMLLLQLYCEYGIFDFKDIQRWL